jgi:hypothetical protein
MTRPGPISLRRRLGRALPRWGAVGAALLASDCVDPLDICAPIGGRIGFFSQGDCVLTRASFFRGHEWLTFFGNEQVSGPDRFAPDEVQQIANGNRRVDWPEELLVHLDNGVYAYLSALIRHTDREGVQPLHFLLGATNSEEEAVDAARDAVLASTREALELWPRNRARALARLGRAHHTIQDSFSAAHTVRDTDYDEFGTSACRGRCGCIERVKAYRARGRDHRAGVLFHGGRDDLDAEEISGDNIGHSTPEDSIYEAHRGCRSPQRRESVWGCLTPESLAAAAATAEHLTLIRRQLGAGNTGSDLDEELLLDDFERFVDDHLSMCSELG